MTDNNNENDSDDGETVDTALLLDRLVSASSGDDVVASLERLAAGLRRGTVRPMEVVSEPEVVAACVQIFQQGSNRQRHNSAELPPEAQPVTARLYLALLERQLPARSDVVTILLREPAPGRLLEACIDVAAAEQPQPSNSVDDDAVAVAVPAYPRVLALQLLRQLAQLSPRTAQQQLLAAPNGLHRLGDLLQLDTDEQVRNEALLLAATLAEWPPVAKVWMFSDVGDTVLEAAHREGGLTGGSAPVLDGLRLLRAMLRHDAALAELVLQSPALAPQLARLLDLRQAQAFKFPAVPAVNAQDYEGASAAEDDDLDDLLLDGSGGAGQRKERNHQRPPRAPPVPHLTDAEEQIVHGVFDIFETVLQNDSVKRKVWRNHGGLCSLVWEMALLAAPPAHAAWNCGVPSAALQQRALHTVALHFDSPDLLLRGGYLDRLLYLVCTAGGRDWNGNSSNANSKNAVRWKDCLALSQSALHVLRRTLPDAAANEMLMHTLAPPMEHGEGAAAATTSSSAPPPPTVIQKLLNTALDNLKAGGGGDHQYPDANRRKLFLSGSLGALALFLTDEPRRSILLRLTTTTTTTQEPTNNATSSPPSLMDAVLECLLTETAETSDDFIPLILLRFVGQWITDCPLTTQAFLQSPHATAVSLLYNNNNNNSSNRSNTVSSMTGLVLGLCLQSMGDDERQCGGWTRSGILNLLQGRKGISTFLSQLEQLKKTTSDDDALLPWKACRLEWNVWSEWCETAVLVVRKRVVEALTSGGSQGGSEHGGSDNEAATTTATSQQVQSMQRLVAEQAQEMEDLRASLAQAQRTVASQEKQLETWKKRVESTPTELDEMLNEVGTKNSELELKIGSLEDEMRAAAEKHQSELKARDDAIASLQQQLADSQTAETESRQECDTLRGDMEALSQAYSSLEEEYQRLQQQQAAGGGTASSDSSTPAGEQAGSEHQQPQGEESNQAPSGGSTEVATLRAENTRLRNDNQAADEWMRMAVERMNTMGAEAAALQAQLDQARAASQASGDEVAQRLAQETETRVRLEQELQQTSHTLNEERTYREQLQNQFSEVQSRAESTAQSLEQAMAERDKLQTDVSLLTQQLESTAAQNQNLAGSNETESSALRASVENLQNQLSHLNTELENSRRQLEEEVSRRDARIQELESAQLSGEASGTAATAEDLRARDEEISQLQQANEAAQDWMGKAVEHHQVLANQIATLTQQNTELEAQVAELKTLLQSSDAAAGSDILAAEELRLQLNDREAEIDHLRKSLSSREEELQQFQSQAGKITQLEKDVSEKQALVDSIRAASVVKDQEIELLRGRMVASNLGDAFVDVSADQESLRAELTERDDKLKLLEGEVDELREEKEKLLHKIADLEASKVEFGTTEEELEALRARAAEVEARNASIEKLLDAVGQEKKELELESQKNREALEKIERELHQLRAGDADTSTHSEYDEKVSEMHDTIKNMETRLVDQQEEASSVIQQWEETYEAIQTEKAELESKLEEALLEKEKMSSELEESRSALQNAQTQLEALKDTDERVVKLETTIKNLEQQISEQEQEAQDAVVHWQASYSELEADYNALNDEKQSILTQLDELQTEKDNKMAEFDRTIKNLEEQLADQERDAANIEQQWQETYDELEKEKMEVTQQLEEARSAMEDLRSQLDKLSGHASESNVKENVTSNGDSESILAQQVKNLEAQLADQENDAASIVQQWQDSYEALAIMKGEVTKQLEETQNALEELRSQTAEESDGDVAGLKSTIKELQQQLDEQAEEASAAVQQWQQSYEEISLELQECMTALEAARSADGNTSKLDDEEVVELRSTIQELEERLRAKEESTASSAPTDRDYSDISTQLQATREELAKLRSQYDDAVAGSVAKSSDLDQQTNRVRQLEENLLNLEEQLKDQEEEANNTVLLWQESYNSVSSQLQAAEEEKKSLLAQMQESYNSVSSQLQAAEEEKKSLLAQMQESYNSVSSQLQAAEEEKKSLLAQLSHLEQNKDAPESLVENTDAVEDIVDVDLRIQSLEEQLKLQEEEAYNTIVQWQESYNSVSDQLNSTLAELDRVRESLSRAEQDVDGVENRTGETPVRTTDSPARAQELEEKVAMLEGRLQTSQENTSRLEAALHENEVLSSSLQEALHSPEGIAALEQELKERRAEMEATETKLQETTSQLQDHLNKAGVAEPPSENGSHDETRIVELESLVQELQMQLASHEQDAIEAVTLWQSSYDDVAAEKERLTDELFEAENSLEEARQQLENQGSPNRRDVAEQDAMDEKVEALQFSLDRTSHEKQVLEKQVEELRREASLRKSQIEELQQRLTNPPENQGSRPTSSIVASLESRISEHMETNHRLESELLREKEDNRVLKQQLANAEERVNSHIESSAANLSRMKESLEAERLVDLEKMKSMEREVDEMRLDKASVERERDELKMQVAGLEEELREMNDALHLRLTNEASDAASDLAATLLREQILDMRAHANETERELSSERKAREAAESEVERLRADLAALLGVENLEENHSEIQQRVMQATENFQRTERSEIESLRKSLTRALDELSSARAAEKEVEERAAKAMHQATLYEQEVVSAKSEFKFLTQTMDEMREAESTKRAALEYRISSLENELSVQRRYHSAEMENLQNELSQINIERDRLFQGLKESEKNKEALVHASSRDLPTGSGADPYVELAKLRIEKTQLLTAAAEEASRIERRLRETRAAARAAAEADIILEKELRINAEKSLESIKIELEEMKAKREIREVDENVAGEEQLETLRLELETLKETNETLSNECESLREQMLVADKESRMTLERLTEECNQAKARASHLEREGRYEAEVRAEVARLQAPLSTSRSVVVNPADDDNREETIAVTKLYDVIQKQKRAIEEERSVYFELLTEHDELLAQLAQQDLLKTSLKSALSREVGESAVAAAIKEAEENVEAQYGKFVKLN